MATTREKGKIHRNEWAKIVARYHAGDTIATIGRAYGCTAPAIRYIIKRSGGLRSEIAGSERMAFVPAGGALRPPTSGPAASLGGEIRQRVTGDIAAFLVALDQAVLSGTGPNVETLQDATDRLMRSAARIRLESEKLLHRG